MEESGNHTFSDEFIKHFWNKVTISAESECWIWQGATQSKGYGSVGIGNKKTALAHRVAYQITYGEIPDGLCVLHRCDNRICVNPAHLYLGTNQDNVNDKVAKGRQAQGENNGRSKLNGEQVKNIRDLYYKGDHSKRQLAELFEISDSNIRKIIRGDYWKLPLAE